MWSEIIRPALADRQGWAVFIGTPKGRNAFFELWRRAQREEGWFAMHKQPSDSAASAAALKFFAWAFAKGGKMAEELDYVPMPGKVVGAVQRLWASQIKDPAGKPVYAISR